MSDCDPQPAVNNARSRLESDNDTVTVAYECLTGFYMTGSARLVCNRTVNIWASPPTCHVINQDINFYNYNNIPSVDDWWYYILLGLLALLALLLLGGLIWCCCCTTKVHSHTMNTDRTCCCCRPCWSRKQRKVGLDATGNLPEHRNAGNHFLVQLANDSEVGNTTPVMDLTQRLEEKLVRSHNVQAPVTNGDTLSSREESAEAGNRVSDSRGHLTTHSLNKEAETRINARPAKDTSKNKKIWLPHTRVVRNNNTNSR